MEDFLLAASHKSQNDQWRASLDIICFTVFIYLFKFIYLFIYVYTLYIYNLYSDIPLFYVPINHSL